MGDQSHGRKDDEEVTVQKRRVCTYRDAGRNCRIFSHKMPCLPVCPGDLISAEPGAGRGFQALVIPAYHV